MLIIHLSENISEPSIDGENETIFTPLNIGIGSGVAGILGLIYYFGLRNKTPGPNKDLKQVALDKLKALDTSGVLSDFEKALKELKAVEACENWRNAIEVEMRRHLNQDEFDTICMPEFYQFFNKSMKLHKNLAIQLIIDRQIKSFKTDQVKITFLSALIINCDSRDKLIQECKIKIAEIDEIHKTTTTDTELTTMIDEELRNMMKKLSPEPPEIKSSNKLQGELKKLEFSGFEKIMINDTLFAIEINKKSSDILTLKDGEISLLNNSDSKLTLNDDLLKSLKSAKFDYLNVNFKDTSEESQKQFKANVLDLMQKLNEIEVNIPGANIIQELNDVNKLTPDKQALISDAIKLINIISEIPDKTYEIKEIIQFKGFTSIRKAGISRYDLYIPGLSVINTGLDQTDIETKFKGNPSILEEINAINTNEFHTEELNKPNKTYKNNLSPFLQKMNTTIDRFAEISGNTSNPISIETINREITAEESQYIADLLTIIKVIWKDELKDANFIV